MDRRDRLTLIGLLPRSAHEDRNSQGSQDCDRAGPNESRGVGAGALDKVTGNDRSDDAAAIRDEVDEAAGSPNASRFNRIENQHPVGTAGKIEEEHRNRSQGQCREDAFDKAG